MQLPTIIVQAKQQHVILAHEDTTTWMKTESLVWISKRSSFSTSTSCPPNETKQRNMMQQKTLLHWYIRGFVTQELHHIWYLYVSLYFFCGCFLWSWDQALCFFKITLNFQTKGRVGGSNLFFFTRNSVLIPQASTFSKIESSMFLLELLWVVSWKLGYPSLKKQQSERFSHVSAFNHTIFRC